MNNVKLRAWDRKNKRFGYFQLGAARISFPSLDYMDHDNTADENFHFPDVEWWQLWSALRDNNNVEIYEGDIFEWTIPKGYTDPITGETTDQDCTTISEVKFRDGCFELHGIKNDKGWKTLLFGITDRSKYGIVVGNIYESLSLLEEESNDEK